MHLSHAIVLTINQDTTAAAAAAATATTTTTTSATNDRDDTYYGEMGSCTFRRRWYLK